MNTIGIGELKHAKKVASALSSVRTKKTHASDKQEPLTKSKHQHPKSQSPQDQEGQLAVDILQTEDTMLILCPIAGVKKEDVKVAIQDDVLTIRGERKQIPATEGKQAIVQELFWGTFSRSIVLPDHIDRKNIQAKVHEHILVITIPKTEDFKTRIIHINEEE